MSSWLNMWVTLLVSGESKSKCSTAVRAFRFYFVALEPRWGGNNLVGFFLHFTSCDGSVRVIVECVWSILTVRKDENDERRQTSLGILQIGIVSLFFIKAVWIMSCCVSGTSCDLEPQTSLTSLRFSSYLARSLDDLMRRFVFPSWGPLCRLALSELYVLKLLHSSFKKNKKMFFWFVCFFKQNVTISLHWSCVCGGIHDGVWLCSSRALCVYHYHLWWVVIG